MRKLIWQLILISAVLMPYPALAAQFKVGGTVDVSQEETKNLYVAGSDVSIKSPVKGDLAAAGNNININENVENDFFGAGSKIVVSQKVGGSARVAGDEVTLSSDVAGDLLAAASNLTIDKNAVIEGDLLAAGSKIVIDGTVDGKARVLGGDIIVTGVVKGDFDAKDVKSLTLSGNGRIEGKLSYSSSSEVKILDNASVVGLIEYQKVTSEWNKFTLVTIINFASIFAFLLLLIILLPKFTKNIVENGYKNSLINGLIGLCSIVLLPIVLIPLFISGVGAEIGFALLALIILLMIVAGAFVPLLIGSGIVRLVMHTKEFDASWAIALLGVLCLLLITRFPSFGVFIYLIFFVISFGTLLRWVILKMSKNHL